MKDALTSLIGYLFAEDKKEHPMPQTITAALLQKIQNLLKNRRENI